MLLAVRPTTDSVSAPLRQPEDRTGRRALALNLKFKFNIHLEL